MSKVNVNPNHYKVAGRERQGEDILQAQHRQKHAQSLAAARFQGRMQAPPPVVPAPPQPVPEPPAPEPAASVSRPEAPAKQVRKSPAARRRQPSPAAMTTTGKKTAKGAKSAGRGKAGARTATTTSRARQTGKGTSKTPARRGARAAAPKRTSSARKKR